MFKSTDASMPNFLILTSINVPKLRAGLSPFIIINKNQLITNSCELDCMSFWKKDG